MPNETTCRIVYVEDKKRWMFCFPEEPSNFWLNRYIANNQFSEQEKASIYIDGLSHVLGTVGSDIFFKVSFAPQDNKNGMHIGVTKKGLSLDETMILKKLTEVFGEINKKDIYIEKMSITKLKQKNEQPEEPPTNVLESIQRLKEKHQKQTSPRTTSPKPGPG